MMAARQRVPALWLAIGAGAVLAVGCGAARERGSGNEGACGPGEGAGSCYRRGLELAAGAARAPAGSALQSSLRSRGVALLRAGCERGHTQACYDLATQLLVISPRDSAVRSADLFERGCTGRPASGAACNGLGEAYAYTLGRPYDEARALKLFQRGCDLGHATACFRARRRGGRAAGASGLAEIARECRMGSPTACIEQANATEDELRASGLAAKGATHYPPSARGVVAVYRRACAAGLAMGCINLGKQFEKGGLIAGPAPARWYPDSARVYYERVCHGSLRVAGRTSGTACSMLGWLDAGPRGASARSIALFREGCELSSTEACVDLADEGVKVSSAGITPDSAVLLAASTCLRGYADGCRVTAKLYANHFHDEDAIRYFDQRACVLATKTRADDSCEMDE